MDSAPAQTTATVANGGANTSDTITADAAHGFKVGDVVRLTSIHNSENTLAGLSLDTDYFIKTVQPHLYSCYRKSHRNDSRHYRCKCWRTDVNVYQSIENHECSNDGRRQKSQWVCRELTDKELGSDETPNLVDNMRITGEVSFRSPEVFTIVPADDESIFRDQPQSASLTKISEMNVLTVSSAQNMLSAIDGALLSVDAESGNSRRNDEPHGTHNR